MEKEFATTARTAQLKEPQRIQATQKLLSNNDTVEPVGTAGAN